MTTFGYDAFNRTTDVTDVNGIQTHTTYDPLNRILTVPQGFGSAQPLINLVCIHLPAGNAIVYTYDSAGRLPAMARQARCVATQPLEQTLCTLDLGGHRIQELRQRILSGSPITDATTYTNRATCHLDSRERSLNGRVLPACYPDCQSG